MTAKISLLAVILLVIFVVFFKGNSEHPVAFIKSSSSKTILPHTKKPVTDRFNPKAMIINQEATDNPETNFPQESFIPQQDAFTVTLSMELEAQWEKEMYQHLLYLDQEEAEKIFDKYQAFRQERETSIENDLTSSIKKLSDMNGQSGHQESSEETIDDKDELKHILSPHYEYLEGARKDFLTTHGIQKD